MELGVGDDTATVFINPEIKHKKIFQLLTRAKNRSKEDSNQEFPAQKEGGEGAFPDPALSLLFLREKEKLHTTHLWKTPHKKLGSGMPVDAMPHQTSCEKKKTNPTPSR